MDIVLNIGNNLNFNNDEIFNEINSQKNRTLKSVHKHLCYTCM